MNSLAECSVSTEVFQFRCEVVTDFADLEKLSPQWERLWKADPLGEIFQSFSWNRAWWRGYGANVKLHCIVVWRGNVVVGLLPLVRENHTLRFLGAPQADYGDFLAEEGQAVAILAAAVTALLESEDWSECILEHLSAQSRLVGSWEKLPSGLRRSLRLMAEGHAPTILVGKDSDSLGARAAKKHLRRREAKLEKSGGIEFKFLKTRDEIREHLPSFFQHQIRRRILNGQESSCLQPEFSAFLRALVEELEPARDLRFGVLEWNHRPLAYHLGFLVNGKFTMYQQAFDVDFWDYSPGEVLLRRLFLYADQNVTREFDFSVGEEPYKARFANHFKPNFTLYIEPRNFAGRLRHSYRGIDGNLANFRRKVKSAVNSNPSTYEWAKYARQWTKELLARNSGMHPRGLKSAVKPPVELPEANRNGLSVYDRGTPEPSRPESVQLNAARLSDLADLYLECPHFPLATRLTEYRERLRSGDTVYVLRLEGTPALIAWTKGEGAKDAAEPDADSGSPTLYDCTFLTGNRKNARQILVSLLTRAGVECGPGG